MTDNKRWDAYEKAERTRSILWAGIIFVGILVAGALIWRGCETQMAMEKTCASTCAGSYEYSNARGCRCYR